MSFEYTEKEKLRVALASILGLKMDPIGHGDLATIVIWALLYVLHMPMLIRRIKIQGLATSLISIAIYVGSCIWFVGDIASNEMVHPTTPLLRSCIFTTFWLHSMLGQMVVYGSLALYSVGLFWEYRYGKQLTMKQAIWIAVPGIVANIVVGVVVTLLPEKKTIVFVKMLQVCNFNPKFKNAVVTMSWVGGLGVLLVAALWAGYWMRNVPGSRDNRLVRLYSSCVALVVAAVFHTTVFYEKPTYPTNFGWRVAVVSVDQAAALTTWWLVKGVRRSKHLGQVEK